MLKQVRPSYNLKPMYQPIKKDIQKADVAFINQEFPLGGDDRPYSGFRNFNTPSSIANDLVDTGFNFVNGANNHAFDQGEEGVKNHIHTWDKFRNKVLFTGVYLSAKEQNKVATMTVNGVKIALLSYTFGLNNLLTNNYTVNTFNVSKIKKMLKELKINLI